MSRKTSFFILLVAALTLLPTSASAVGDAKWDPVRFMWKFDDSLEGWDGIKNGLKAGSPWHMSKYFAPWYGALAGDIQTNDPYIGHPSVNSGVGYTGGDNDYLWVRIAIQGKSGWKSLRVYYDNGYGFTQQRSRSVPIFCDGNYKNIFVFLGNLPGYAGYTIKKLRIDPLDDGNASGARFIIGEISLRADIQRPDPPVFLKPSNPIATTTESSFVFSWSEALDQIRLTSTPPHSNIKSSLVWLSDISANGPWNRLNGNEINDRHIDVAGLTDDTTYYCRVKAVDRAGNVSNYSQTGQITKKSSGTTPGTPVNQSPSNTGAVSSADFQFDWTYSSTVPVSKYRLRVYSDSSYSNLLHSQDIYCSGSNEPSYYSNTWVYEDGNTYYWQVCAYDSSGKSGSWSADSGSPWYFTYLPPPSEKVNLVSPPPGANLTANPVNFTWDSLTGAVDYKIEVYDWAGNKMISETTGGATGFNSYVEFSEGIYTWQVSALTVDPEFGNFSEVWNFSVHFGGLKPDKPVLDTPYQDQTVDKTSIHFSWRKPPGTDEQRIEIGTANIQDAYFPLNSIVYTNKISANEIDVTTLSDGTYYWHVKSEKNENIWSDWSETRKFTASTDPGPPPPNHLSPPSPTNTATVNDDQVTLAWDSGWSEYRLVVEKDGSPFWRESVGGSTSKTFDGLDDATYSWRVQARSASDIWIESSPWTFTIVKPPAPSPPNLSSPVPGYISYDRNITFSWDFTTGAVAYWFQIRNKDDGKLIYENKSIPEPTRDITRELDYGNYTWKVKARNSVGIWGDWSTPRTLYVKRDVNNTQQKKNQNETHEPINTATGAYYYSHQDLVIPGRGLPFEFARFYNSRADFPAPMVMGNKWKHTYLISLDEDGEGSVVIHWADCTDDNYTPTGGGQYENAYGGYSGKLIKNGDGSFDFTTKGLITYHFDNTGRLTTVSDRNNNALTLSYDGLDRIDFITDTVGRTIDFQYDGNGYLWKVIDPITRTIVFTYEPDGDLSTFTDARGNSMTYQYDTNHNITQIIDRRSNNLVRNAYDSDDRVTSQTNAKWETWELNYTPEGITTVTDALGGVTTHDYNDYSWIAAQTDANGNTTQYDYDENGNRIETTNARGYKTSYTYDAHSNVLTITDALDSTTSFEYNSDDQVTKITDALGRETSFEYDPKGNLTRIIRPMGQVTDFEYYSFGQLIKVTDPLGNETTYGYDIYGNRTSVANPLTQTTQFTYDAIGRLLSIVEPTSETIGFTYDENDNLVTMTDQDDHVTSYTYDANNNRIALRNPLGFVGGFKTTFAYNPNDLVESITDTYSKSIAYSYDALDRLISLTDRRSNTFSFEYDAVGNRIRSYDAYSSPTHFMYDAVGSLMSIRNANNHYSYFTYDALDRLIAVTDALGNRTDYSYDDVGRLIQMTDANGNTTTYEYDNLDRLLQVTDPLVGTAKYTYDLNGNRTSITDPNGHLTTMAYDDLNRLVSDSDPLGNIVSYSYDSVGNLLTRTDARDNVTSYTYSDTHWLKRADYPTGSPVTFTYDKNGNRIQMDDSSGPSPTVYQYDNLDRITQVTDPFGNAIGYGYDESSNRKSIDYDAATPGVKVVNYTFDDNGRLISLADWAAHTFNYSYDPVGNIIEVTYPNGCKEKRTYYANERLAELWHEKSDGSKFIEYAYYYDDVGNIIGMDRKEAVEREFAAEETGYTYNQANEIQSANTDTFAFDEDGNQTGQTTDEGTTDYTYDYENRLTELDPPGSDLYQFTYNGVGDRLAAVENGTTKRYLLDVNKPLTDVLADMDGSNNVQQYYLYGIGLVARVTPSGDIFCYHPDHLGSIMAVTDTASNLTAAFTYDEFGAVASFTGSEAGPWRFHGIFGIQIMGNRTLFMGTRYVDSLIGRFTGRDAALLGIHNTQLLHRYIMVINNPLRFLDPSGLCPSETYDLGWQEGFRADREDRLRRIMRLQQEAYIAEKRSIGLQYEALFLEGVVDATSGLASVLIGNWTGGVSAISRLSGLIIGELGYEDEARVLSAGGNLLDMVNIVGSLPAQVKSLTTLSPVLMSNPVNFKNVGRIPVESSLGQLYANAFLRPLHRGLQTLRRNVFGF